MKRLSFLAIVALLLAGCGNQPSAESTDKEKSETPVGGAMPVDLPYKMQYSNWTMGDPQNLKIILDMYKNWEDNKLDAAAAAFADSTYYDLANGNMAVTTKQNILDSFKVWRGMSGSLSSDVITGLSLHSPDKNEDWVLTWSLNRWTSKDGKTDSSYSNDNWQLKNGKIAYMTSFEQKIKKK
ncbi:MAG TPA: hypothetical protein VH396_18605 [Chitinophagaceae bacterium]|jgi:hypothetical protein